MHHLPFNMSAMAMLLPLGWIWTPVAAAAALALAWVAYRAFVYPALDPLRVLPGPSGSRLFGVLPEIMREQTCAPQMRWVEQVRDTCHLRITCGHHARHAPCGALLCTPPTPCITQQDGCLTVCVHMTGVLCFAVRQDRAVPSDVRRARGVDS